MHLERSTLSLISLLFAGSALAQGQPQSMADCTPLLDNAQRLACFDHLAAQSAPAAASAASAAAASLPPTATGYAPPRNAETDAASSILRSRPPMATR